MHENKGEGGEVVRSPWITRALALVMLLIAISPPARAEATVPALSLTPKPIPENEAMQFLKRLGVGWNMGNTFDAVKAAWNAHADEMTLEASWCGVYTTEEMIQAVHDAGFSTIRIPVSWHDHVSGDDFLISERWMARVQEVVDWAIKRGMYVILNIHHDEDEFDLPKAHEALSARYIASVWAQIAARFRDYDEHLIFESMNEPRLMGSSYEWAFDKEAEACLEAADCLNKLNQIFVDTVRASGGENEKRYLMVPGYCAAPENALGDYFALPQDTADNRIIVSVHAYTPYAFALQEGGISQFDLSSNAQKSEIAQFMEALYQQYIRQGIPVVIGEFGARNKGDNLQDRVNFTAFYAASASIRNLPVLWWDNNAFTGNGELFGLFRRADCSWPYPKILEALIRYGGYDKMTGK